MTSGKESLVIFCKTYRGDYDSFCRLFASLKQHNSDNIPFYVSVPNDDVEMFKSLVKDGAHVLSDESYAGKYFTTEEHWGLSTGYINQEICKLSFWEADLVLNYLCVDSDAYFIRDFKIEDFMANETTPYSVLVMDKDLNTQHFYYEFGQWRREHIKRIFEYVDYDDKLYRTCHGMTVLNSSVLMDLKKNLIEKKNISYEKLIEISPYEYSWYNAWLQKSKIIEVVGVEPFFKTFHLRKEYLISRISLIKESNLAEYYVGIVMNSNWKPTPPPQRYRDPGKVCEVIYNNIDRLR